MLDIVAADQDELALPVEVERVDHAEPLLAHAAAGSSYIVTAQRPDQEDDHGDDDDEGDKDAQNSKRLTAEKRTQELHTDGPLTGANANQPAQDNTARKAAGRKVNNWLTEAPTDFKRGVRLGLRLSVRPSFAQPQPDGHKCRLTAVRGLHRASAALIVPAKSERVSSASTVRRTFA